MEFEAELFKQAGLNKGDIAALFGVSRTTVHNWHTGKKVHALIQKKVKLISDAVSKAVKAHKLPADVSRDSRAKEINAIIKDYL